MPSNAAFALDAVSKTYGSRRALDGVALTVVEGEMLALIGPSGSGKSTLLRALNGTVRIDSGAGRVEAFGQTVQAGGKCGAGLRALRARIGFVFQQFNLVGRLSLYRNVSLGLLGRAPAGRGLLGLWSKAEAGAVMAALQRVGVADYAGQRASTLSGGQQQRGAIARALVQRADAVLADEPVASLDPAAARRVMELLQALNRQDGLTVVVTLHQVDFLRYCSRVVALREGRVVYDGAPAGLDQDRLAQIYGAEIEDVLSVSEQS